MKKTTSRSVRELCDMTTPGYDLAEGKQHRLLHLVFLPEGNAMLYDYSFKLFRN